MAKNKKNSPSMADTADRHVLYQEAVQNVEGEIDFVEETFKTIRGRDGISLREDFCGTANTSCEWIRRGDDKTAICVDIDTEVLEWGKEHNVDKLTPQQQARIKLVEDDVFKVKTDPVDMVLAMNFSYWIFEERTKLREYFKSVREALNDDGIFFCDFFAGYEAFEELEEPRDCEIGDLEFEYIWDQHSFDPITAHMKCFIHFVLPDGSRMDKAFSYEWRLWTIPELREIMQEAGFSRVTVYLEGDDGEPDEDGNVEGNGIFEPAEHCDADAGILGYFVAEK